MKHIIEARSTTAARTVSRPDDKAVTKIGAEQAARVVVDAESAGQRLDNFLIRQLKGVPKSHVYRIIRKGEVRVNKGRASAETHVQTGDVVRVPPIRVSERSQSRQDAPAPPSVSAAGRSLPIVFEDDEMIVVDKPAGTAVHGGSGVSFGVIEQLRLARPQAPFLELVHRLDRDTSGLLLVAKKRSALKNLQDQFRERTTGKTYLTLVPGTWPAKLKVLDQPLHKYLLEGGERRVKVVAADHPDAMRSVTLVRVSQVVTPPPPLAAVGPDAFSLLAVTIKTGRTHQIRVHLSNAGHPIVGDDKYGDFELNKRLAKLGFKRMFLHAWRLSLLHPKTGQAMSFHAPMPSELHIWCAEPAEYG